jgi:HK97 family phage prohead protease
MNAFTQPGPEQRAPLVGLRPIPIRRPRNAETKDMTGGESAAGVLVLNEDAGVFEGYASLFGVVDLGRDMVMPGAFRDSLARRGVGGIRLLWQHDPAQPLGVWSVLREDERGLFVRGRLNLAVARARELHALMRQGAVDGLSIGYRTVTARTEPRSGVRRLNRLDLWEISLVTFPLLPQARVFTVKASVAAAAPASLAGLERRHPRRPAQRFAFASSFFRSPATAS